MNLHKQSHKFFEDEFGCTSIGCAHEVTQLFLTQDHFSKTPLFYIFFEGIKAVQCTGLLIDGESSFRVTNPFFLLSFEEDL